MSFPIKRICAEKAQSLSADFTDDNGVDVDVDDYDDENGDGVGFKSNNWFFCIKNEIKMEFVASISTFRQFVRAKMLSQNNNHHSAPTMRAAEWKPKSVK